MSNKLKQSIQEHAYNETKMLRHIMNSAHSQGIVPMKKQPFFMTKTFRLGLSFALVMILAIVGIFQFNTLDLFEDKAITAVYALDVNPSFEISVNKNDKVISITAINEDALKIEVEDLFGKSATSVIETLIKRSEELGFINTTDLVDDYILVSVIPMDDKQTTQTNGLEERIAEASKDSSYLQNLNVAVIKSTLIELREAEAKKIPIGLYVINGMVKEPEGEIISAKEFFSDPVNRATFQTKGVIKTDKVDRLKARILIALGKLDAIGVDTTDIKNRLITAKDKDLIDIQNEVRKLLNKHHLGSTSEVNAKDEIYI
ncbi:MAG: hypothetical protein HGB31_09145 [Erysipelotrichaceae bacterium]|nr:hypothetical protein [Erysipelotrichaceae bacterium]